MQLGFTMTASKHFRKFRLDRLYFRYLKGTKFERMNVVELASFLEHKKIISLVLINEELRYEQIKNISRQDFLNLMKGSL